MDEGVQQLLGKLKFTEAEMEIIEMPLPQDKQTVEEMDKWMVAKLISNKIIDGEMVMEMFRCVWASGKLLRASCLEQNFFLFKFTSVEEKVAVLEGTPWSYGGDLLAIKDFEARLSLNEHDFSMLPIWLRIYNVPLGWMNREIGEKLGNALGKLLAVDFREGEGDFFRIRVEMDCKSPLRRCLTFGTKAGGQPRICPIKYERLPCFCHGCGIIGHSRELCTNKTNDHEVHPRYGEWLKVQPPEMAVAGEGRKKGIVMCVREFGNKALQTEATTVLNESSAPLMTLTVTQDKSVKGAEATSQTGMCKGEKKLRNETGKYACLESTASETNWVKGGQCKDGDKPGIKVRSAKRALHGQVEDATLNSKKSCTRTITEETEIAIEASHQSKSPIPTVEAAGQPRLKS
ncbi:hypothetical protein F3Y22_tig00110210pilonHSYRG00096 [Hibiscus syriacus]|uniref:DUF4283 domain-containing protein n=1 Tax=Hibiscus syriacus TaxID=106335 RepID=A0A6A3BCS9_HIBSY|nr:hypothetical protein F3Y22_tig00110210pilonHSYRG00096 [Hibiscus syriacus]